LAKYGGCLQEKARVFIGDCLSWVSQAGGTLPRGWSREPLMVEVARSFERHEARCVPPAGSSRAEVPEAPTVCADPFADGAGGCALNPTITWSLWIDARFFIGWPARLRS
jgi:hypothetical protein